MDKTKMEVPAELQAAFRELAKVAVAHGLTEMSVSIRHSEYFDWGMVTMTWEQGRHGEDQNQIKIHGQLWVNTTIKGNG